MIQILASPIVGNNFRDAEARYRYNKLADGEELRLIREPENPYDSNAIQVHTEDGIFLGFIPKARNTSLAKQLDAGLKVTAHWDDETEMLEIKVREHRPDEWEGTP
jgi:hypothetical protein